MDQQPIVGQIYEPKEARESQGMQEQIEDSPYVFYNIYHPTNKVQCVVCKKDISKHMKLLAKECDYCPACFSQLKQFPDTYHAINKLDFALFDNQWTSDEQLLMFEGLQKHGFGNWSQIAEFIATTKAREQVENHYTSIYLESPNFLPTNKQIISKRDSETNKLNKDYHQKIVKIKNRQVANNTKYQRGHLTVNSQNNSSSKVGTTPAQIIGYMPRRGDFEVQYDNEAELLLAEMQFNDDDTHQEKQMKFRLIEIYNFKLTERIKRKQFVISRNLLDLKEKTRIDKMRSKQEKQIYNMMRVFARYHGPQQHQKLVQGILRQKQIRQRIQQLKQLKKRGFKTLADVEEELESKRKKQQKIRRRGQDQTLLSSYDPNKTRRSTKIPGGDRNEKRSTYISKQQQELCKKFNLPVKTYLEIKDKIIQESIRQGILSKDTTSKMFKIDRGAIESIFDFLVEKEDIISR